MGNSLPDIFVTQKEHFLIFLVWVVILECNKSKHLECCKDFLGSDTFAFDIKNVSSRHTKIYNMTENIFGCPLCWNDKNMLIKMLDLCILRVTSR